jgi:aryl-phospho-beta-D-glucosidase BglC (GH1 family)
MKKYISIFSFLCLAVAATYAQIPPHEAITGMGRGINLGNTLDDYINEGVTWPNVAQESFFEAYSQAGFTCVRIPITWNNHTDTAWPYTIKSSFLERVEEVMDWALDRDMWVIINAHHEDWLFEDPSIENFDRLDSIWSQVSTYFQHKSDSLLFEIINEPRDANHVLTQQQVDDLNQRVLSIIRKTNPTRNAIIGGKEWSNKADLMAMRIPDDKHLIGYFHAYDPWDFAGEGNGTWGSSADINLLSKEFAQVAQWSRDNDIPVLLGEFGARTRADFNSRMRWYAAYVETALINGFAYCVWDDNGWFQVLQRNSVTWAAPKDILVNYSEFCPNNIKLANYNGDSVALSWSNRIGTHNKIVVERGSSSNIYFPIDTISADSEIYIDTTVSPNSTYYYRVAAVLENGEKLLSYPQLIRTAAIVTSTGNGGNGICAYPHPFSEYLNVEFPACPGKSYKLLIYDINGALLFQDDYSETAVSLDLGYLFAGQYLLKFICSDSWHTIPITKK